MHNLTTTTTIGKMTMQNYRQLLKNWAAGVMGVPKFWTLASKKSQVEKLIQQKKLL